MVIEAGPSRPGVISCPFHNPSITVESALGEAGLFDATPAGCDSEGVEHPDANRAAMERGMRINLFIS
jgi:hypothetical protein